MDMHYRPLLYYFFHIVVVEVAGVDQFTLLQLLDAETLCRRYSANVPEFAFQVLGN